jgi:hypothetical protein
VRGADVGQGVQSDLDHRAESCRVGPVPVHPVLGGARLLYEGSSGEQNSRLELAGTISCGLCA